MHININVNGRTCNLDVPQGTTLLGALRDDLGLTGTRYGCGLGVCGSCFVLADGQPVASCMMRAEEAHGKKVVTIEGLARDGVLHPVQEAFIAEDAMQCGYCVSGILISAAALLAHTPKPTDDQIREALAAHLCRCGVYLRFVKAVKKAAAS
jgi:aerobic-type carbon monoxide dehydrogenase small subunit (CoxS/CutS family)